MRATFLLHISCLAVSVVGYLDLEGEVRSSQPAENVCEIITSEATISEERKVVPPENSLQGSISSALGPLPPIASYWGTRSASESEEWKPFPLNFYPELPTSTVERQGEDLEAYVSFQKKVREAGVTMKEELLAALGWPDAPPKNLPKYLDRQSYGNRNFFRMTLNIFPYDLPSNMIHFIASSWLPMVTEEGFKSQNNGKFPSEEYKDPEKFKALLEYVTQPGLRGYVGNDVSKVKGLKARAHLHKNGEPWTAGNQQKITEEEGRQADQWAMREFKAYIEEIFPVQQFDVVWEVNGNPKDDKNLHQMELIVRIKKAPNVQLMPLGDDGSPEHIEVELGERLPEFQDFWLWKWVDRNRFEQSWFRRFLANSKNKDFKPVPRDFDDLLKQIDQGVGLYAPREAWSEDGYAWYKKLIKDKRRTVEEEIRRVLRWTVEDPKDTPEYLKAKDYENKDYAKLVINVFPWLMPKRSFHFSMWSRVRGVTPESLERVGKEEYPNKKYKDQSWREFLADYMNRHDLSYVGPNSGKFNPSDEVITVGGKIQGSNGEEMKISYAEIREAMNWATRHLRTYLESEFVPTYFKFATTRSPNVNKGIQVEHDQVLVQILPYEEMSLASSRPKIREDGENSIISS